MLAQSISPFVCSMSLSAANEKFIYHVFLATVQVVFTKTGKDSGG